MYIKYFSSLFVVIFLAQSIFSADYLPIITSGPLADLNRALLIFLDDGETNDNDSRSITGSFCYAFDQKASPILVSASVLHNVIEYQKPTESDPGKIFQKYNDLQAIKEPTVEMNREMKGIAFHILAFKKNAEDWIIKKVNHALYLLIPKQYLVSQHIEENEVKKYVTAVSLTDAELKLGLKVNHMQTVVDISEIKRPNPKPKYADYFVNALEKIFVSINEYREKNKVLAWVLYLHGHGSLGESIAHISLKSFKDIFMVFLEKKLRIKMLCIISCYIAGINSEIIYRDLENDVSKDYSFPIIIGGLPDVETYSKGLALELNTGVLTILKGYKLYDAFLQEAVKEVPDYKKLMSYVVPLGASSSISVAGTTLQIKYPGLSWFSVLDDEHVVSIDAPLVKKYRNSSLDIEVAFGKKRDLLGILLYVQEMPFTLQINVKNSTGNPPEIISMVPGTAVHHIREIYSSYYKLGAIRDSFMKVGVGTDKIFVIDKIWDNTGGLIFKDVVVHCAPKKNITYYCTMFERDDPQPMLWKDTYTETVPMTPQDRITYTQLLMQAREEVNLANPKVRKILGVPKANILRYMRQVRQDPGLWWAGPKRAMSWSWENLIVPIAQGTVIGTGIGLGIMLPLILTLGWLGNRGANKSSAGQLEYIPGQGFAIKK